MCLVLRVTQDPEPRGSVPHRGVGLVLRVTQGPEPWGSVRASWSVCLVLRVAQGPEPRGPAGRGLVRPATSMQFYGDQLRLCDGVTSPAEMPSFAGEGNRPGCDADICLRGVFRL